MALQLSHSDNGNVLTETPCVVMVQHTEHWQFFIPRLTY